MHQKWILMVVLVFVSIGMASAQANDNPESQEQQTAPQQQAPPPTISDAAKKALADEWNNAEAVPHMIAALGLYIEGGQEKVREALGELLSEAPDNEDLYRAAQGAPDDFGQPTTQGLSAFLDMLATATTLKITADNRTDLFKIAKRAIGKIFSDDNADGKQKLVRINQLFNEGDKKRALYKLLSAVNPKPYSNPSGYTDTLELLRTAYADDTDRLASLVAAMVGAPAN